MAKLYFRYGAMNSGKSTDLLQVNHNYRESGMNPIIAKPTIDTKSEFVLSRLNVKAKVDWPIGVDDSIMHHYTNYQKDNKKIDCILVDEAQFLSPSQIDELYFLVTQCNIPVIAYGLRTDFRTRSFPGSLRLLELAHTFDELKTICVCGKKAIFNARKVRDKFVQDGSQVSIDLQDQVSYISLCGACYMSNVGPVKYE